MSIEINKCDEVLRDDDRVQCRTAFTLMRRVRKCVCSMVSLTMFLMPVWAFGTETNMSAIGHEAQSFANDIAGRVKENPNTLSNGTLTITMPDGSKQNIKQTDLQGATGKPGSNISSSMTIEDIEALKGIYNNNDEMNERGEAAKEQLFQDAATVGNGKKASLEGYVYSILNESYLNRPDIDMAKDPMFDKTNEIIGDLENIVSGLADCSAETIIKEKTDVKHVPDYKECTQVLDHSGTCKLIHNYSAGVVDHYSGPYNINSCGKGCTEFWIGDPSDQNLWAGGGECRLYPSTIGIIIRSPSAVRKAVITDVYWDDQMQIYFGPAGREEKIIQVPYAETFVPHYDQHPYWRPKFTYPGPFSGASHTACQQRWSWHWGNAELDVTNYFRQAKPNDVYQFIIRVAVQDRGEGFARLRIYYDPTKTVYEESWTPTSCLEALQAVNDGFAEGSVRCTNMPPVDASGCMSDNGIIICPSDMARPPHPSINPLCKEMSVTSNWDFYKGQMDCWIDANGNRQCPQNVGGKLDTCKQYENNPECQFIRSQCTEGASGASGTCYVNDVVYDCGKDVPVTDSWADTQYKCPGDIACMGNDCIDTQTGISTDFAKVNALLNAMQYMTEDMACTGMDDEGNPTGWEDVKCTVFGGEAGECKQAVGGVADCCESVPGVGIGTYIQLIRSMSNLDSGLNDLAKYDGLKDTVVSKWAGQYVELKGELVDLVTKSDWYKNYFSTPLDNISGMVDKVVQPIDAFVTQLKDQIKKKCEEILTKIFNKIGMGTPTPGLPAPEQTAEKGAEQVTQTAGEAFMSNAATVFTVVSWIYTAYVVATMIIQMVYACEDEEYELVSNRDMGNCHYVGSYCKSKVLGACVEKRKTYCCYQSPLSRIMNEQIRLQGDILGIEFDGFGTAKQPKCTGVPLEKIDLIDWDRIDLSEWTAILQTTGNLPTADSISLDSLTGKGSPLDFDGARLNSIERTIERLKDTEVDQARTEMGQAMEVDRGYEKDEQ